MNTLITTVVSQLPGEEVKFTNFEVTVKILLSLLSVLLLVLQANRHKYNAFKS
jgi:hypothetical protein